MLFKKKYIYFEYKNNYFFSNIYILVFIFLNIYKYICLCMYIYIYIKKKYLIFKISLSILVQR